MNDESSRGPQSARITELGGFEVVGKIGQGGMGAVYKARQKSLDRIVALKVLPPRLAKNSMFIERFMREARASAKLNHPNIIQGIDVGRDKGLYYFAMEYVDGQTLKTMLKQRGPFPDQLALRIMRQVALALECAHGAGLIHRDIKPDNILYTADGTAKLADLGLAKDLGEDAELTQSGTSLGTPYYISPEQAKGEKDLDGRSDLYSLGATWFHLLTGRPPYEGETSAVIMVKHLNEPVPQVNKINPEVGDGIGRLIERLMRKNRAQRPASAKDLIAQIDALLSGQTLATTGILENVKSTRLRVARTSRQAPLPAQSAEAASAKPQKPLILGAVAGALLFALFVGFFAFRSNPKDGRKVAGETETGRGEEIRAAVKTVESPREKIIEPPPKADRAAQADGLRKALAAAKQWEKDHGDDYAGAGERYEIVRARAQGTALEMEIADEVETALRTLEERRTADAEKFLHAMRPKAEAAVKAGDYDEALRLMADVPKKFAAVLGERVRKQSAVWEKEVEEKILATLLATEAAATALEPSQGPAELQKVETPAYAPLRDRVKALKTRLEEERANEGELKRKREAAAAEKKFAAFLERFDAAVLKNNDWSGAKRVAAEATADASLNGLQEKTAALKAVADAVEKVRELERESLAKLEGREVDFEWGGEKGWTVKKVTGDSLVLVKKGLEMPVKLANLPEEQRRVFRGDWKPETNERKVAAALELLAKIGDGGEAVRDEAGKAALDEAEKLLAAAEGFPLTEYWQKEIRRRQIGAAELAAEESWKGVEAFLKNIKEWDKATGSKLSSMLNDFERDFSKTALRKEKSAHLARLRDKAEDAIVGFNVKKLFNGRVEDFDLKTGAITLFYDFENPQQSDDWEMNENTSVREGKLTRTKVLAGAFGAKHKAPFAGDLEIAFEAPGNFFGPGCSVTYDRQEWVQFAARAAAPASIHLGVRGAGVQEPYPFEAKRIYQYQFFLRNAPSVWVNGKAVIRDWNPRFGSYKIQRTDMRLAFAANKHAPENFGYDNVRIKGTLQNEWLSGQINALRMQTGLPAAVSGNVVETHVPKHGLPEIQKLFRGRVENYDPETRRISLSYDFQKQEHKQDWKNASLHPRFSSKTPDALFSGELEFSCVESVPPENWPGRGLFLGIAGKTGTDDWECVFAGLKQRSAKEVDAKVQRHNLYSDLVRCSPKMTGTRLHTLLAKEKQPTVYLLNGQEVARESLKAAGPLALTVVRPLLQIEDIRSVLIVGTLDQAWLANALLEKR